MNESVPDGDRICAGMHYADSMLFISMARILATFDIRPAKDENGNEIIPELKFNSSIVRYVSSHTEALFLARLNDVLQRETLDFKCSITPRSDAARVLVSEYAS